MTKRADRIHKKLSQELSPSVLEVIDESMNHASSAGETHYRVRIVSELFDGQTLVGRHRKVYGALAAELATGLHALAIEAISPAEWAQNYAAQTSPDCAHKKPV